MTPQTSRCRTCGTVQLAGAFFCGECGNSILASAELAPSAITDTQRVVPVDLPPAVQEATSSSGAGAALPGSVEDPFVLEFSTGDTFPVTGHGFLGRNPVPAFPFDEAQLVRIVDPQLTVSKAHLEFGVDSAGLWIIDLRSGNGTIIQPVDASPWRAEPGKRYGVSRGWRVRIGEQYFDIR